MRLPVTLMWLPKRVTSDVYFGYYLFLVTEKDNSNATPTGLI